METTIRITPRNWQLIANLLGSSQRISDLLITDPTETKEPYSLRDIPDESEMLLLNLLSLSKITLGIWGDIKIITKSTNGVITRIIVYSGNNVVLIYSASECLIEITKEYDPDIFDLLPPNISQCQIEKFDSL